MIVGLATDLTGLSAHNPGAAITAWSETTPFFDTGSNFSGGSTFTAPFRAFYTFRINLYGRTNDTTHEFSMVLQKTSVSPAVTVWDIFNGDYAGAVEGLLPVEPNLWRMGGSIAQRDLVEWTLTEAAIRSGKRNVALSLANERLTFRPKSVVNKHFHETAQAIPV